MSEIAARAASLAGGRLAEARRLTGGNLSQVLALTLADGRALVAKFGATARAEARMLAAIAATGTPAPAVVGVDDDLLVITAVPSDGRLAGAAWQALAEALARLHVSTTERYGWVEDHAFGTVAITNTRGDDWPAFWAAHRLCNNIPHVAADVARRLERLAGKLGEHLPARPPAALLHGDLWGGNVLVGGGRAGDEATVIDPACYYGDREVDVAMLTLFDAPPESFLAPLDLAAGWRERLPVYRLWPLLVHLRLFGDGYRGQVEAALDRLGA